jgi:uncharacterized membrane protein
MSGRFKRKDWIAIAIGFLTVVLGAGGVFMPDWVNHREITQHRAYAILVGLALLIIIFLVIQQFDLNRAESEQARREKEREAKAQEREKEREQREALQELRESKREKEIRELIRIVKQLQPRDSESYDDYDATERAFERIDEVRRAEQRMEDALQRGEYGSGDYAVRHGGSLGGGSGAQLLGILSPLGDSVDVLREKAYAKLRSVLDKHKTTT